MQYPQQNPQKAKNLKKMHPLENALLIYKKQKKNVKLDISKLSTERSVKQ